MILSLFGFVVFTRGRFVLSCLALCFCVVFFVVVLLLFFQSVITSLVVFSKKDSYLENHTRK